MLFNIHNHFPKWIVILPAVFTVACFFYFNSASDLRLRHFIDNDRPRRPPPHHHHSPHGPADNPFAAMYQPLKPDVAQRQWTDWLGNDYTIEKEPRFWTGIGKYICIIDVDSRDFPIIEDDFVEWTDVDPNSAGVLNHFLYAKIHGYDYKFMKMPSISDRHDTWLKVAGIAQALQDYQFVVFLDNDATFANLELPLEWMLNHWDIHENITLAVSDAPPHKNSQDAQGNRMANTGFIVAQNTPLTHRLMQRWAECPDENDYDGCDKFREDFPHEQGAFSDFISYDDEFKDSLIRLTCDETNGRSPDPDVAPSTCEGKLIKHWWASKKSMKPKLGQTVMRDILRMAQGPGPGLSASVEFPKYEEEEA